MADLYSRHYTLSTVAPVDDPDAPPGGAPPAASGRISGPKSCLLATGIAVVLGFGSMAISKYVMERRNESVLAATRELERILGRAAQGEGVAGLQAMGCEVAGALEPEALAQLGQRLEEEQARKKNRAPERVSLGADLIVYCAKRSEPPSCAAVASSYRAGVATARAFVATVQTPKEVHCSERFAEDGRALGSAAPPNLPPLLPPP